MHTPLVNLRSERHHFLWKHPHLANLCERRFGDLSRPVEKFEQYLSDKHKNWAGVSEQRRAVFTRTLERRQETFKRRKSLSEGPPWIRTFFTQAQSRYPQAQSPFFALPAEIRNKIYAYVLNDQPFLHPKFDRNRLRVTGCEPDDACSEEKYDGDALFGHLPCMVTQDILSLYDYRIPEAGHASHGRLPLLMSCRRAYTEAIDLLYSRNTFYLTARFSLQAFIESVPRRHLYSITSVVFLYARPADCVWKPIMSVLEEMRGLKRCRMVLEYYDGPYLIGLIQLLKRHSMKDIFVVDLVGCWCLANSGNPRYESCTGSCTTGRRYTGRPLNVYILERFVLKDVE